MRLSIPVYFGKLRMLARSFWDWGASWNWWAILISGALGAMPRIGEYGLSICLILIAAFGITSKLAHWPGRDGSSKSERRVWKAGGMLLVFTGFVYMVAVTTINAVKDDSWSNLPKLVAFAKGLRSGVPTSPPYSTSDSASSSIDFDLAPIVTVHRMQDGHHGFMKGGQYGLTAILRAVNPPGAEPREFDHPAWPTSII
jgi:hypothetical protein